MENTSQIAFAFVKPDSLHVACYVLDSLQSQLERIENIGQIGWFYLRNLPGEILREHYKNLYGRGIDDIMNKTVEWYSRQGILAGFLLGKDIVARARYILGHSDPVIAKQENPDSLRAKFSDDSLDLARKERRPVRNVMHISSSAEEAQRERGLWMPYIQRVTNLKLVAE